MDKKPSKSKADHTLSSTITRSGSTFPLPSDKDPVYQFIINNHIEHLAVAAGDGYVQSFVNTELPKVENIQMWSLKQLYKLRSDIIHLKSFIDKENNAIHSLYEISMRSIINKIEEKDMEKPIRRVYISKMSLPQKQEAEKHDNEEVLVSSMKSVNSAVLSSNNPSRYKNTKIRDPAEPKQITADTIWESTELFLKPIENPSRFEKWFIPTKPTYDQIKLNEPLGTHYSETFPKTQKYLSDPNKAKLKMPLPPFGSNNSKEGSVHRRLLCAFVPVEIRSHYDVDSISMDEPRSDIFSMDDVNQIQTSSLSSQFLNSAEMKGFPVINRMGNSPYGQISFEERLRYELEYAGMLGEGKTFKDDNNPVISSIRDAINQQKIICDSANYWRNIIYKYYQTDFRVFQDRVNRRKAWDNAISIYTQQQENSKQNIKKSKSRPQRIQISYSSDDSSRTNSD